MNRAIKLILSMELAIVLFLMFALGSAVATFIENDFGTETAWAMVYDAAWFEAVQVLLGINLLGNIFRYKIYKLEKLPSFIFHVGFLLILIGSGITRYIGFEGMMHIREGYSEDQIISNEPYIQVKAIKGDKIYSVQKKKLMSKISNNSFSIDMNIDGKIAHIKYLNFLPNIITKEGVAGVSAVIVQVEFDGDKKEITMYGRGKGSKGLVTKEKIAGVDFRFEWGSKMIPLPFSLKLKDFQLERYPGSMSPSSYASEVVLIDESLGIKKDFRIFMNHVLDHRGYRFFQSSYDQDEKGTILSVNHDPGKLPTYIGYFMLGLGFFLNILNKKSRFRKLARAIDIDAKKASSLTTVFIALIMSLFTLASPLKADNGMDIVNFVKSYEKEHANRFGTLLVQGNDGRLKPIDTLANEILNKIARKRSFFGLNADQIILGMMSAPQVWQKIKIIKVSHPRIKKIIGIGKNEKYASFSDFFNYSKANPYKLAKYSEVSNRKRPIEKNQFDKELLRVDERLNVCYLVYTGELFKLFPKKDDPNNKWYSPKEAISTFTHEESKIVRSLLTSYFDGIEKGIKSGNWSKADNIVEKIKEYQKKYGSQIIQEENKIKAEILYNKLNIFPKLIPLYLLSGFILLMFIFAKMIKPKISLKLITKIILAIIVLSFATHTFGMALRWYIAEHAPWSDSYESMLYIAWAIALAGMVFSRQSIISLSLTAILAGITLFVAHLSWMDPQITTLVPVLKSYWLSIHVSVITASYGFLGLSSLLGFFTLILFILINPKKDDSINEAIKRNIVESTRINEMSMILGLSLLTLGNFLGGVWANESWGRYWGWDPKETWALISILVYAAVVHLRFIPKLNNQYAFAVASTISYSVIIMTYFGVNFYLSGMHSYAAGDPVPVPKFVYYTIAIVFAIIVAAYPKRGISSRL